MLIKWVYNRLIRLHFALMCNIKNLEQKYLSIYIYAFLKYVIRKQEIQS